MRSKTIKVYQRSSKYCPLPEYSPVAIARNRTRHCNRGTFDRGLSYSICLRRYKSTFKIHPWNRHIQYRLLLDSTRKRLSRARFTRMLQVPCKARTNGLVLSQFSKVQHIIVCNLELFFFLSQNFTNTARFAWSQISMWCLHSAGSNDQKLRFTQPPRCQSGQRPVTPSDRFHSCCQVSGWHPSQENHQTPRTRFEEWVGVLPVATYGTKC